MARFIMAGRLQAFAFVSLATLLSMFLPLLGIIANASVALVTLRSGWNAGLILALVGSVATGLATALLQGDALLGFMLGFSQFIPVIVAAWVLTRTVSWTSTLQALIALGFVGLLVFFVFVGDVDQYWTKILAAFKPLLEEQSKAEGWDAIVTRVIPWMTSGAAYLYILFTIASLLLARHWQAQLYNPGGFGEEFRSIKLGKEAALAALAGVLLALFTGHTIVVTMVAMMMAVFFVQGLSLIHGLVKQTGMNTGWLVGIYIFLILLPLQVSVMLTVMGLIDNFIDIRQRLPHKK